MLSSSTRIACALSLFVAARITLIGFVSRLKRSADRLKRMPKSTRWAHTLVAKHRGPGMARAELAMDGVFCVFAKGVCALSQPVNLNAAPYSLSQRINLNTTPYSLSQRINLNTTPYFLSQPVNLNTTPLVLRPVPAH